MLCLRCCLQLPNCIGDSEGSFLSVLATVEEEDSFRCISLFVGEEVAVRVSATTGRKGIIKIDLETLKQIAALPFLNSILYQFQLSVPYVFASRID
jgi:hypothetical protein